MYRRAPAAEYTGPTPLYTYEVDGLGSTDPQTVAVSAHATAAGVYTVAAIMGFVTVVFDYDMAAGKATQVYKLVNDDGNQDEMVIAVRLPITDFLFPVFRTHPCLYLRCPVSRHRLLNCCTHVVHTLHSFQCVRADLSAQ